jgi:hypothetical protein
MLRALNRPGWARTEVDVARPHVVDAREKLLARSARAASIFWWLVWCMVV